MVSRQLFLEYLVEARRGLAAGAGQERIRKDAVKQWNLLSVAEKMRFNRARKIVLDAVATRDRVRQVSNDAVVLANAWRTAIPTNWDNLVKTAEAAAKRHRELVAHQTVLQGAVTFFMLIVWSQDLHARARLRAQDEVVAERTEMARIQTAINGLQGDADFPPVPVRADGSFKMFETSISDRRLSLRKRGRQQAFRTGIPPVPPADVEDGRERWEGAWMMTGGGMSTTGIWVGLDVNDQVVDRVVRKDTVMRRWQWAHAEYWDGDVRDGPNRVPMEAACHRDMAQVANRSTEDLMVPNLRTCVVDNLERIYGLYMSYCPHGDLTMLIRRYRAANQHLPEPFLWYVFLSLAEAGLAMETSDQRLQPPAAGTVSHAKQIVHRDLKPSNVFLDTNDAEHFTDYPAPKLGDFGLACKTWPADTLNPQILVDGGGTKGFKAPEMRSYVDRATLQPIDRFQLLAHTNCWGIGMIMYCLVCLQIDPPQKDWLGDGTQDVPDVRADARFNYGNELLDLIQDCLAFQPAVRPSFRNLIQQIDGHIDEGGVPGAGLAFGMKNVAGYDEDDMEDMEDIRAMSRLEFLPADAYAIGLHRDQLPVDRG